MSQASKVPYLHSKSATETQKGQWLNNYDNVDFIYI